MPTSFRRFVAGNNWCENLVQCDPRQEYRTSNWQIRFQIDGELHCRRFQAEAVGDGASRPVSVFFTWKLLSCEFLLFWRCCSACCVLPLFVVMTGPNGWDQDAMVSGGNRERWNDFPSRGRGLSGGLRLPPGMPVLRWPGIASSSRILSPRMGAERTIREHATNCPGSSV